MVPGPKFFQEKEEDPDHEHHRKSVHDLRKIGEPRPQFNRVVQAQPEMEEVEGEPPHVVLFYGSDPRDDGLHVLSNFTIHEPFTFWIPACCNPQRLLEHDLPIHAQCAFAEKAIMLCKAAAMGDEASYSRIMATSDPRQAKSLGRRVRGFNEARWKRLVCGVAEEVCVRRQHHLGP